MSLGSLLEEVLVVIGEREDTTVALAWDEWEILEHYGFQIDAFTKNHVLSVHFLMVIYYFC